MIGRNQSDPPEALLNLAGQTIEKITQMVGAHGNSLFRFRARGEESRIIRYRDRALTDRALVRPAVAQRRGWDLPRFITIFLRRCFEPKEQRSRPAVTRHGARRRAGPPPIAQHPHPRQARQPQMVFTIRYRGGLRADRNYPDVLPRVESEGLSF